MLKGEEQSLRGLLSIRKPQYFIHLSSASVQGLFQMSVDLQRVFTSKPKREP